MKQQKRLDRIIEAVESRIQEEIGALLGADFSLIGRDRKLVSKENAFDSLQGKQICAQMDISGEITGNGCLLIGIKDAIRLGGTLIMLPSAELEEVIGREEYSEELEDSYGEIANIIAGSFTKDFEEMYPKSCRFVRKEQEVLSPGKVDIDTDIPIVNQTYYQVSFSMVLEGRQMGDMVMLMPAAIFDLQEEEKVTEQTGKESETPVQGETPPRDAEVSLKTGETTEPGQDPEPRKGTSLKIDVEKHRKKVDRLLEECQKRMEAELTALLGVGITLGDIENRFINKEDFFQDRVTGRQVLADMEVVGEMQGKSYLAVSVKDAIHLGGILIMLPPAELINVVKAEDFSEDARDAYGEIANIISGVYSAIFEEQYNKKLRFIRKELRDIIPAKVEVEAAEPLPDITYYMSSISMAVEGKTLGRMHMLFPAELLSLAASKVETPESAVEPNTEIPPVPVNSAQEKEQNLKSTAGGTSPTSPKGSPGTLSPADSKKHQKLIDKILAVCKERMAGELSALLGSDIKLSNLQNLIVGKEEFFFEEVSGKQVLANMDVVGELEGKSYLSVSLRDAIRLGSTLIMLPANELESTVAGEEFGEDAQDAYSEIANIITGVYTTVFEEQYIKRIRFIKTNLQNVAPMKVDIDSNEPIADQDYYLSRMDLRLGDLDLGKVNMLFPLDLLQLGGLRSETVIGGREEDVSLTGQAQSDSYKTVQESDRRIEGNDLKSLDILVVGDDEMEAAKIAGVLVGSGYSVKELSFKDNLNNYIPGNLKAIYLVMNDVNEQVFGVAIKVSSACSVPLIAAGPGWTRTKVIKAVKYGVRDILLTPASKEDIEENVHNNLLELAA